MELQEKTCKDKPFNIVFKAQNLNGQPVEVKGNYVITAYGNAEIIETFKNNALSALEDSQTVVEAPIS